jgi:DNA-binding GntR family transcriptional regulator
VNGWLATRADRVADRAELTRVWIEEQVGSAIVEVTEQVTAGVLTPTQGRALSTRGGTPCLHLLRRYLRRGGAIAAAIRDTHPADRVSVGVRLRRAEPKGATGLRKAAAPG